MGKLGGIGLLVTLVIELEATNFKPEHTGQLGFYLTALDAQVKAPEDAPTIGLLLCKSKNRLVARYPCLSRCRAPAFNASTFSAWGWILGVHSARRRATPRRLLATCVASLPE